MTINIGINSRQIGDELTPTVNGRDLHRELGIGKDYTNWAKAQIKRGGFVENSDYVVLAQKGVNLTGGRPSAEYHFTVEAGKHIGMLSGTTKGREVRKYFLECERRVKSAAVPGVRDARTAALIEALVRQDTLEQEQVRQATELARLQENVAVIEARTQPENKHFTVMGYANLIGRSVDIRTAATLGRKCAALSREKGIVIGDVSDPRFGAVHSYHESILQEVLQATTAN
ncbi:antA/AntB antirepressor family protein [Variovorax sp. CAN2819]|uniref:antA/AntB antirepressor family protein n=1 Tax=Variovorax sp. CAN15 TaxID=3046727 RepID=UPI00264A2402|nr:antA/AntB antirepressor family protein [Variovorax sp. CAN15]MDN6883911.1 antA/AntB antirepressor family protein [Variovorax sp. CAN15]